MPRLFDRIRSISSKHRRRFAGQTVIFSVHAGGLGDNLAYTGLPRLYKYYGASKVMVSTTTNYGEPFCRNDEVADLVWGINPFLDGITSQPPNVGVQEWPPHNYFKAAKHAISPIDTVAQNHDLSVIDSITGGRIISSLPDIFYHPKTRTEFSDKVICDPTSISQPFEPESFEKFCRYLSTWYDVDYEKMIRLRSRSSGPHGNSTMPNHKEFVVSDLKEYCDILFSAKMIAVTEAGSQSLAAALRKNGTHVLMTSRSFNERIFIWPNNNYHVTSRETPGDREWP